MSFDAVGPLHKAADPAAHGLYLTPRWSVSLLVLLSGVPRFACSPSSDRPATGRAANLDSVRCRGTIGAGHLAASHTIGQAFVLPVVHRQVKVYGRECGSQTQSGDLFQAMLFRGKRVESQMVEHHHQTRRILYSE